MDLPEAAKTEEAFAAFVDRWYGSSLRLARLLGPDEETARRATSDAWLAVVERLSVLERDPPLHVPVLRATIESVAARIVAGNPLSAFDPDSFEAEGHRWAGWWRDEDTPTDWEHQPADDALVRALADLDPAAAAVVLLRDVERLPAGDVEHVLDVTPADQRALLDAGRVAIWKALA